MALNWPTFFTRLGSAIVFAAIMMTGFLWQASWPFMLLMGMIMLLCYREYLKLADQIVAAKSSTTIAFAAVVSTIVFYVLFGLPIVVADSSKTLWLVAACLPILLLIWGFLSEKNLEMQGVIAVIGMVYIALPCALLNVIRQVNWMLPLILLLLIWTNDTMAYLVGSFIGKTPFSKISPKKTWEGTGGGVVFTVALAAVWGHFSGMFHIYDWMALAACAAIAGTAGDLMESKLKRMAGVKDSGKIMPGHGGALDRFDSLLVATPFAYVYVAIFMQ